MTIIWQVGAALVSSLSIGCAEGLLQWTSYKLRATKIELSHWSTGHSTQLRLAVEKKLIYKLSSISPWTEPSRNKVISLSLIVMLKQRQNGTKLKRA